jgi:hypothetical protein
MIARREDPHPGAPVDLHRHRRTPLPGVHHRPRRPRHRLPRSPLPGPRPRRTSHLRRQRHRAGQPALRHLHHQPRLAAPQPHRLRPARLGPTPHPRPRLRSGRTQTPPLLPPARRRRHHPLRPAPYRQPLALGRPARRRLRPPACPVSSFLAQVRV